MGKPRNTWKYPTYPEIPDIPRNTRKYRKVKKIPGNTRSYFSTLVPDPNLTRYPVFCPIPDPTRPDIEKPYPLGTAWKIHYIIQLRHRRFLDITLSLHAIFMLFQFNTKWEKDILPSESGRTWPKGLQGPDVLQGLEAVFFSIWKISSFQWSLGP